MTILKTPELFDYPENADWERLDSVKMQQLAKMLVRDIFDDLRSRQRLITPGLRKALRRIEEVERGF